MADPNPTHDRLAILSGAASPALKRQMDARIAEEEAALRLGAVAGPDAFAEVVAEADRRADVFAAAWATNARRHGAATPRAAAYESVARDVMEGLFP